MGDTLNPSAILGAISAEAQSRIVSAERVLTELAATYSPEGLFAASFVHLIAHPEGTERHAGSDTATVALERLVFLLWRVIPAGHVAPTAEAVRAAISRSRDLAHDAVLATAAASRSSDVDGILNRILTDAHIVRGSAYPEQTLAEVRGVFGHFDAWFQETLGVSASELADCLFAIAHAAEERLNRLIDEIRADARAVEPRDLPEGPRAKRQRRAARRTARTAVHRAADTRIAEQAASVFVPRDACYLPTGHPPSDALWGTLLRLIGLDRGAARQLDNVLLLQTRPVVVSDERSALVPNVSTGADALWDALDAHAKSHPGFYTDLQAWKGEWHEARVVECLRRVFGHEAVYANLRYPNPDQAGRQSTELDAAVAYGPFIFLVEAKARQFSLRSQLGDLSRLRGELRANIEDAFEQALRARRYIDQSETAVFSEAGTGRSLSVPSAGRAGTVLMTVSLHFLGSAATRLAQLRGLGLMSRNEYPWAVSVSELDLITRVKFKRCCIEKLPKR